MFKHTVKSELIQINAPVALVWDILVDVETYGTWNPFTWRVESSLVVGEPVDLYVRLGGKDRLQTEQVREVREPHLLSWGTTMGASFLLKALREQVLEETSQHSCSYYTTDALEGLLTPLVVALFGQHIQNGFNDMGRALKAHAETRFEQVREQES